MRKIGSQTERESEKDRESDREREKRERKREEMLAKRKQVVYRQKRKETLI